MSWIRLAMRLSILLFPIAASSAEPQGFSLHDALCQDKELPADMRCGCGGPETEWCKQQDAAANQPYEVHKDWWSHDIVSSLVAGAFRIGEREVAEWCRQSNCREQIIALCKHLKDADDWNPVELTIGAKGLAELKVDPIKLCNHPWLQHESGGQEEAR